MLDEKLGERNEEVDALFPEDKDPEYEDTSFQKVARRALARKAYVL